jgi:hypothetical protein
VSALRGNPDYSGEVTYGTGHEHRSEETSSREFTTDIGKSGSFVDVLSISAEGVSHVG